jgi:hypothetical protein
VRLQLPGGQPALASVAHDPEHPLKLRIRDGLAPDPDPLVRAHEVRGGVQAGAAAGRAEHRVEHRRHRSFSVRAADQGRGCVAFGMIEERKQSADAVEPELDAVGLQTVEPGDRVIRQEGAQQISGAIIARP